MKLHFIVGLSDRRTLLQYDHSQPQDLSTSTSHRLNYCIELTTTHSSHEPAGIAADQICQWWVMAVTESHADTVVDNDRDLSGEMNHLVAVPW